MAINPNDPNLKIQETLISVGAQISEAIRTAIENAADDIDATILQRIGNNLKSRFATLAKLTDDSANNIFRIKNGLIGSESISKQLQSLEEKKLSLARQLQLATNITGQKYKVSYNQAMKSLNAQEKALLAEQAITDSVENRIGLTGKLAGVMKQIPGLGKLIDAKEIEQELRKSAVTLDANGKLVETNIGKIGMMAKGFQLVGKQIVKNLLDPLTIANFFIDKLLDINKASVELQRITGQTGTSFNFLANGAATTVQILETQVALSKQLGLNAQNAFSYDVLANAADLTAELGLAAEEAGGIAIMSQTSKNSVDSITDSIVSTTSAFNGANRSAISQGQILRDVAKTSESIKLSLGNNPVALANAASQARRLGVELNELNNIANNLLDFESSIEKELEAQLLTGNQINLSKARELALNNDLKGVGEELFKNTVEIEKFGRMNRLQQEAQAEALGMTRDQLARVAYLRSIEAGMTEAQAEAAAKVSSEDMKRLTIQDNIAASLDKISAAIAPILEKIGEIASIPFLGPAIMGAAIFVPLLVNMAGNLTSVARLFVSNTAATVAQTTANASYTTSQAAANAAASTGSGVFARMGTALGSFGASAAASIPVLLSIAAVGAGIGVAFLGVAEALKTIPEILKVITLEKATAVAMLATSFASLAAGLSAVALAGPLALPVLLATGAVAAGLGMMATRSEEQSPIQTTEQSSQMISLEPVVTELRLLRQESTTLLKKLVENSSNRGTTDWDTTRRDMRIYSYTS